MKKLPFILLGIFLFSCEAQREILRFCIPYKENKKIPEVKPAAKEPEKKQKSRHYPPYYNAKDFYKPTYTEKEKQNTAKKSET